MYITVRNKNSFVIRKFFTIKVIVGVVIVGVETPTYGLFDKVEP